MSENSSELVTTVTVAVTDTAVDVNLNVGMQEEGGAPSIKDDPAAKNLESQALKTPKTTRVGGAQTHSAAVSDCLGLSESPKAEVNTNVRSICARSGPLNISHRFRCIRETNSFSSWETSHLK